MRQKPEPESGGSTQGVAKELNSGSYSSLKRLRNHARAGLGSLTAPPKVRRGRGTELADSCKVGITK